MLKQSKFFPNSCEWKLINVHLLLLAWLKSTPHLENLVTKRCILKFILLHKNSDRDDETNHCYKMLKKIKFEKHWLVTSS